MQNEDSEGVIEEKLIRTACFLDFSARLIEQHDGLAEVQETIIAVWLQFCCFQSMRETELSLRAGELALLFFHEKILELCLNEINHRRTRTIRKPCN